MSSLLFCWRELPGVEICPETLVESLEDLESRPGLVGIPVQELAAAFRREFGEVREENGNLSWESGDQRFEAIPVLKADGLASLVPVYCSKDGAVPGRVRAVAEGLGCRVFEAPESGG